MDWGLGLMIGMGVALGIRIGNWGSGMRIRICDWRLGLDIGSDF